MNKLNSCIICNNNKFSVYKNGTMGEDIWKCENCGLVFTNPRPDFNSLKGKYGQEYFSYWIRPDQQKRRIKLWERRLKLVKQIVPTGKLLDVGCGEGLFISRAQRAGYEVYGIEISTFGTNYAKEKLGLKNVYNCLLEEANFKKETFDIIIFWHVLEHLLYPNRTLEVAYSLLRPDGYVIIAVPNVEDKYWLFFP